MVHMYVLHVCCPALGSYALVQGRCGGMHTVHHAQSAEAPRDFRNNQREKFLLIINAMFGAPLDKDMGCS